ncbi:isochorismatase family protein [Aureispira anguillae]|uniref:nicotinamidase n=1 Tax=Aureispira anguillae TaxID=2864201 RepID=A0A916DPX4_9BACT|nr:isochorismatase family protein [Aureispira anguillae]BDS10824.1 isochorismatase family protein [Aureispira anguillae]
MKALILVDLQNDFGNFGALALKEANEVIAIANQLMHTGFFDLVIASRYWQPADHKIFAANHFFRYPNQLVDIDGHSERLWSIHCVQDSFGASFIDALELAPIDKIVSKRADKDNFSYSCFFPPKINEKSELLTYLKASKVEDVFLLGFMTEFGIKESALDAQKFGFRTHLIKDACRAANLDSPKDGANSLELLQTAGITLLDSDQLML